MLKVGDKVTVTDTYKEAWVTIAKKGTVGYAKEIKMGNLYVKNVLVPTELVTIEKMNGETMTVPSSIVIPYKKREVKTNKSMTNEELLEKYADLVLAEAHSRSINTKSYSKILDDTHKCQIELLYRLNK